MSKQQKTIPVFLCGRCPVPAPAGSAVDLWQPGKTDSKTPHHPSRKVDRPARFVSAEEDSPPLPGGFSSSQEELCIIFVSLDFN